VREIATIEGVEVQQRPVGGGGLHLSAPGRALLAISPERARLVLPAAALDLGGDVGQWLDTWVPWATRVLGLPNADGWHTVSVDVHEDVIGVDMPDAWLVHPDAWTGRSARRDPSPDGYDWDGRLRGVWLGLKADSHQGRACDLAVHGYNKSYQLTEHPDGQGSTALAAAYDRAIEQAYPGIDRSSLGPVWRWEAHLQGKALVIDTPEGQVSLRDPRALADKRAIAVALAYVFGVPGVRNSGAIRLTDERERAKPAKRRSAHRLWELLRQAGAAGPKGRIVQAREARALERAEAQERAAMRVGQALGRLAGAVGAAESPAVAAKYATAIVPTICKRADWAAHVTEGRLEHAAIQEPPSDPTP
jgi:hypothetical protein